MPPRLRLVVLGPPAPDPAVVASLVAALRERVGMEVVHCSAMAVDPAWWVVRDRQLSSNDVVDALVERCSIDGGASADAMVVAVTAADLVAEGREFVFGEATQGGFWAVVSIARLGDPDHAIIVERLLKEIAHEVGHLGGLDHCDDLSCVMARSGGVDGIDRKGVEPCPSCRARLDEHDHDP